MNKKEIIAPVIVIGLSLGFIVICLAVFFSNGKSKKWIARKMKIGGLLLSLTAASCNGSLGRIENSCYDIDVVNYVWFYEMNENGIEINLDSSNVISGQISGVQDSIYSFKIIDEQKKIVQKSLLLADSGSFDMYNESFKIKIDTNLSSGQYDLFLYNCNPEIQDSIHLIQQFDITITE